LGDAKKKEKLILLFLWVSREKILRAECGSRKKENRCRSRGIRIETGGQLSKQQQQKRRKKIGGDLR